MYLTKGLTYDDVTKTVNTRNILNESISYCGFLQEATSIESSIYDLANRTALATCQGQCGILTEGAVGDALTGAKDFIAKKIQELIDLIKKVFNSIMSIFKKKNEDRKSWISTNKGALLMSKPTGMEDLIPFIATGTVPPTPSFDITAENLAGDPQTVRALVVKKLTGKTISGSALNGSTAADALQGALLLSIMGKTSRNAKQSVNLASVNKNQLLVIMDRSDILNQLGAIETKLTAAAQKINPDDNQEAAQQTANIKWTVSVVQNVTALHSQLADAAEALAKQMVNTHAQNGGDQ